MGEITTLPVMYVDVDTLIPGLAGTPPGRGTLRGGGDGDDAGAVPAQRSVAPDSIVLPLARPAGHGAVHTFQVGRGNGR